MSDDIEPIVEEKLDRKKISYSQYSDWLQCAYKWKLGYMDKLKKYSGSVHTFFGTAIHFVIQAYIDKLYNGGSIEADSLDLISMFRTKFDEEIEKDKTAKVSENDYDQFIRDGETIINYFTSYNNRSKYFPSKKYIVKGIELPIRMPIMNNLEFIGFIDIVLEDVSTGKIKIIDLKTSNRMWNKYQQQDQAKINQLLFYKAFYSQQFGVPLNKIEVEFLILKRNLIEGASFPESRIQRIVPINSKNLVNESVSSLVSFVENCFTEDGEFNVNGKFRKNPHKGKTRYSNCNYCEFSIKNGGTCDRKED